MGRAPLLAMVVSAVACGHSTEGTAGPSPSPSAVASAASLRSEASSRAGSTSTSEAGATSSKTTPREPKHYKTVVHTGDSMVGGGLCKALAPRFKAEGTKFVRDVWESASISAFDESDRIPTLMKRYDPDLVLLTLGANDVFNDHPEYMIKHIESIVKKVGHRDCIWIGPPLWKGDKGLVEVIREHAAPCRFFDSGHLVLPRAGDGIHPTEKGGEVWADAFWPFFKEEIDGGS